MKIMTMPVLVLMALWTLPGLINTAAAQNALGNGQALDNNLQQGSGGRNATGAINDSGRQYGNFSNAVVTGNVTGLSSFRGDVGYSAPGAFGDSLGSDDLFRFRAQSYPAGSLGSGGQFQNRQISSQPGRLGEVIVLNPAAGTFGGEVTGEYQPVTGSSLYLDGGQRSQTLLQTDANLLAVLGGGGRVTGTALDRAGQGFGVGVTTSAEGQMLSVSASPLTGVVRRRLQRTGEELDAEREMVSFDGAPQISDLEDQTLEEAEAAEGRFNRFDDRLRSTPLAQSEPLGNAIADADDITTRLDLAERVEAIDPQVQRRYEASRNAAPGEDVYIDLLREIQRRTQMEVIRQAREEAGIPEDRLATPPADAQPTAEQRRQQLDDNPFSGDRLAAPAETQAEDQQGDAEDRDADDPLNNRPQQPDTRSELEKRIDSTVEEYRKAREALEDSESALALPELTQDTMDQNEAEIDDPTPQQMADAQQQARERMTDRERQAQRTVEEVIDALDYDLPAMQTMASQTDTPFNEAMLIAEQFMRDGEYFKADLAYRRALRIRPGYPLARVGLSHAQMGAGMFRSAGTLLIDLFTEHPELISAKYAQPVLPNDERLAQIRERLQENLSKNNHVEPALLLGYLAYQQGRTEQARDALNVMQRRSKDPALAQLLVRLWVDKKSNGQDADAED